MPPAPFRLEPSKSAEDDRNYRFIQLENEMKCILVSDPETDKASISVNVRIGHYCDPDEVPGIAHFLEHMIFLGTEKYPEESSFEKFISMHGGSSNAFTSDENTCYYMDINYGELREGMKMFSSFFSCPLFSQNATDRELQAIENEHSKNLQQDNWKLMQLGRSTADPGHVHHKFGTGNAQTLKEDTAKKGIDIRKELFKFYESYYSANLMAVAVVGRESLDELEAFVVEDFSEVVNKNFPKPVFKGFPYKEEQLQLKYNVVPVKDLRQVSLTFQIPSAQATWRLKEHNFLGHLLGHEGPGSVLSQLKNLQWANELAAGLEHNGSGFGLFGVQVDLTEEGFNHIDEIVQCIFEYLELVRQTPDEKWQEIFEELSGVQNMQFRFKSKETPMNYVTFLTSQIHKYPPEHILNGPWLLETLDIDAIKEFLGYITPQNLRMSVMSKEFDGKTDQKEFWYGTDYTVEEFPKEVQQKWSDPGKNFSDLRLPDKNDFITSDFSIFEPSEEEKKIDGPERIYFDKYVECWHKLDTKFKKPKAILVFSIISPEAYLRPRNMVLTQLYIKYLTFSLAEFAYAADIAGLSYDLGGQNLGISLTLTGYNQKMDVLFSKVIEKMKTLEFDEKRLGLFKEVLARTYRNFWQEQPYHHVMYNQAMTMENKKWHQEQYLEALTDLTVDDLKEHMNVLFRNAHVRCLVAGNMTKKNALDMCHKVKETLKYDHLVDGQEIDNRVVRLENGHTYIHSMDGGNPEDVNSAICNVYQIGPYSLKKGVLVLLLQHMMRTPCYEQLRTIEQNGYIVWSGMQDLHNVLHFRVIIQSSDKSVGHLDGRIEAFLKKYRKDLEEMSEETFETHRDAAIKLILEKVKRIDEEATRFWKEIATGHYMFDRQTQEANTLREQHLQDFKDFFDRYIVINAPERRKLSLRSVPKREDNTAAVDDNKENDTEEALLNNDSSSPRYEAYHVRFEKDTCTREPVPTKPAEIEETDNSKIVYVKNFADFKASMSLYPNFPWRNRSNL